MTQNEQEILAPIDVINLLEQGNKDFVENGLIVRNHTLRMVASIYGQYPYGVVLSCIDSRVPVEDIFQTHLGDLFVIRIAGNVINNDILGSLEFSCKVSGAKLILVLGHTYCGAIKSAIDKVKCGHITSLIEKIEPSVLSSKLQYTGDQTSSNSEFVEIVCKSNILESIKKIRDQSPILKEMESNGDILIKGAMYDLETGKVTFLE